MEGLNRLNICHHAPKYHRFLDRRLQFTKGQHIKKTFTLKLNTFCIRRILLQFTKGHSTKTGLKKRSTKNYFNNIPLLRSEKKIKKNVWCFFVNLSCEIHSSNAKWAVSKLSIYLSTGENFEGELLWWNRENMFFVLNLWDGTQVNGP